MDGDELGRADSANRATNADAWRGTIDQAMIAGRLATSNDHRALMDLEHDVLEQWRAALANGDASRVGQLVELGHAVKEVLHRATPADLIDPSSPPNGA